MLADSVMATIERAEISIRTLWMKEAMPLIACAVKAHVRFTLHTVVSGSLVAHTFDTTAYLTRIARASRATTERTLTILANPITTRNAIFKGRENNITSLAA